MQARTRTHKHIHKSLKEQTSELQVDTSVETMDKWRGGQRSSGTRDGQLLNASLCHHRCLNICLGATAAAATLQPPLMLGPVCCKTALGNLSGNKPIMKLRMGWCRPHLPESHFEGYNLSVRERVTVVESVERVQHKSLQLRCIHEHIDIHINTVANKLELCGWKKRSAIVTQNGADYGVNYRV
ncbi:unnamed protein product [Ceratitis capitata]|uniref:(Mediterranean fruit fly) hypothetical protein n=1 Tax=Ceratitis capitata TaxID=7213 RepID=A0A811VFX8_CERCA|nr:unnamed protein product [Ceratitis capitata]